MKLICKNVTTLAFNDQRVTLEGDNHDVIIRFKDREKDFDTIKRGDEVEITIGSKPKAKTKAKK